MTDRIKINGPRIELRITNPIKLENIPDMYYKAVEYFK